MALPFHLSSTPHKCMWRELLPLSLWLCEFAESLKSGTKCNGSGMCASPFHLHVVSSERLRSSRSYPMCPPTPVANLTTSLHLPRLYGLRSVAQHRSYCRRSACMAFRSNTRPNGGRHEKREGAILAEIGYDSMERAAQKVSRMAAVASGGMHILWQHQLQPPTILWKE